MYVLLYDSSKYTTLFPNTQMIVKINMSKKGKAN